MKPRTFTSVKDFLASKATGIPVLPSLPYDTYANGKAGFLTLSIEGEFISFSLSTLTKASQLGAGALLHLEFGRQTVTIKGSNLAGLYEDILLARVRVVRVGAHPSCTVTKIGISKAILA